MIRVLHILGGFHYGGAEQLILNIYRNIDREKVQFDFLTRSKNDSSQVKEVKELGGKVYVLPEIKHPLKNYLATKRFFELSNEYSIMQFHMNAIIFIQPLLLAKKHKIGMRIVHGHSTMARGKAIGTFIHKMNRSRIDTLATHCIACSNDSAQWMFGNKKSFVWYNAVDTKTFEYNERYRDEVRKELGVGDEILLGTVGRLTKVKNLFFLIQILKNAVKIQKNVKLLLVGDGELKVQLNQYVIENNLENHVILGGVSTQIHKILAAMDVFIMPSLYEGVSLALLEAQASGIPCLVSDKVPKEGIVLSGVKQRKLEESAMLWAETAIKMCGSTNRIQEGTLMRNSDFDIKSLAKRAEEFYIKQGISEYESDRNIENFNH